MRLLRLLPLLALPLLLLGATCVTSVEQKGPTGPWIGEVVNTGPEAARDAFVSAEILDATGKSVAWLDASTCPPTLLPGQRGTFELFFPPDFPSLALPLQARVHPLADAQPGPDPLGGGLSVRLLERYADRRAILVEVRNDSIHTYRGLSLCANLRTPGGELIEVGSAAAFPSVIRPGETRGFPLFFNSLPYGVYEFFPSVSPYCCSNDVVLDPSLFSVSATRVVEGSGGEQLQVVGEVRNASGQDLGGVMLQAYLEGNPLDRVEVEVGCRGTVLYGSTAPVIFTLPLPRGSETRGQPAVVVVGIQGSGDASLSRVPVSNVSWQRVPGSPTVLVAATLTNPSDSWLSVNGACLNLRGADGTLVGTASSEGGGYIGPGETMTVSGEVVEVGKAASAEVVAYGYVTEPPPEPILVPANPD